MKNFFSDPVLLILLFATFVFTGLLLFVSLRQPSDGQTFQVMSGLATGFAGAVLARVKPQHKDDQLEATEKITIATESKPKEPTGDGGTPKVD